MKTVSSKLVYYSGTHYWEAGSNQIRLQQRQPFSGRRTYTALNIKGGPKKIETQTLLFSTSQLHFFFLGGWALSLMATAHSNKSEASTMASEEYQLDQGETGKGNPHGDPLEKNHEALKKRSTDNDDDDQSENENEFSTADYFLETGAFPALASLDPITRTMTAQTQQSIRTARSRRASRPVTGDLEKQDKAYEGSDEQIEEQVAVWDQPWHTEGWRNPGWLVVLGTFLVNFVVAGNSFSWGVFQEL